MDGETALDYSRTRYGSSDLDRIHRQQQVIFAAINKASDRGLVGIDSLASLWKQYKDTVDTDVNDIQAPGFARLAAQIDPKDIAALSIGVATVPWTGPQGQAVLLADKDLVQQLVNALFGDRQLTEEAALVEVQDASQDGLADRVVDYLDDFGFSPDALTAASPAGGSAPPVTEIIDYSGKDYTAELLANLLDVPLTQVRDATAADRALSTVAGADVLVILGVDAQAREFAGESVSGG
jgi:hypothetical protein